MRLAEKFSLPIFTFIDTPGAYPGIGAEERGQSEAIARNLYVMAELKTPIVCTIVGEGGSGGALAIGVGDRMLILQYSTYSVISPEGCASILWKSADKASVAAETLGITADRLKANGLVDRVVEEPLGGAQRDWDAMFQAMRRALTDTLAELRKQPLDALLDTRYQRLRAYGSFKEIPAK
jgi:acetyl-CoA carboxylase carboxyl transferase subunit alpha